MIDKRKLYDELTESFIEYQSRLDGPMQSMTETRAVKICRYQTDPMFRARVQALAAGVMQILDKHLP